LSRYYEYCSLSRQNTQGFNYRGSHQYRPSGECHWILKVLFVWTGVGTKRGLYNPSYSKQDIMLYHANICSHINFFFHYQDFSPQLPRTRHGNVEGRRFRWVVVSPAVKCCLLSPWIFRPPGEVQQSILFPLLILL
jgi:hypothetical protein